MFGTTFDFTEMSTFLWVESQTLQEMFFLFYLLLMYATSYKKKISPAVGGIGIMYFIYCFCGLGCHRVYSRNFRHPAWHIVTGCW